MGTIRFHLRSGPHSAKGTECYDFVTLVLVTKSGQSWLGEQPKQTDGRSARRVTAHGSERQRSCRNPRAELAWSGVCRLWFLMQKESDPEKKPKIRPRGVFGTSKNPVKLKEPSETQEEAMEADTLKLENPPRSSGIKFQPRAVSKPLDNPAGDAKATAPAAPHGPGSESVDEVAQQPSKTLRPEGWESSFIPAPAADRETVGAEENKPKSHGMDPITRKRATKRIRLIYALAGGVVAAVVCSIVSWNMGFGAGVQNSLDEETKERATVPKESLGELDQALADLRAGKTENAVKKLQELEGAKTDIASLTYLLAVAAVQNGDIKLAETKTAESIEKRERISDSLALQAVLETQKAADPSIKKFGDTRVRSETLLRQAMLADAANPFPMVELATLLRYQKRNEEALALLRGARSRLNPVDSHTVIDVTIALASLQDTPDSELPQIAEPGKDLVSAFSSAYTAMRKGNFDQAADIVKIARKMAAPDLFEYLINDPAIRRYAAEPKLREFFQ